MTDTTGPPDTALMPAPLEGEILGPDDTLSIVAALHPMKSASTHFDMPLGVSLAEIAERAAELGGDSRIPSALEISIDGHMIEPAIWRLVRPKRGAHVLLHAVPRGGGGGLFKSLALIALAVITAVVAPYLAGFVAAAGTVGFAVTTALISGAITVAGALPRDIHLVPARTLEVL